MSLSDLASLGSFVSGLAVLATLALLLVQLRQAQSIFLRAENNVTQDHFSAFRLAIVANREVAALWVSGRAKNNALDEIDDMRFVCLLDELFWALYHMWDRVQRGVLLPDEWDRSEASVRQTLAADRARRWWDENKLAFPSGFVQVVNRLRQNNP